MKKLILAIAISFLALPLAQAWGAPSVSGASGTFLDGHQVTITGAGFGSGPSVKLFDDFSGGPAGSIIPLASPTVGAWSQYSSQSTAYRPTFSNDYHSPPYSDLVYNNGYGSDLDLLFSPAVTEAFYSFWVKIPNETVFPYYASVGPLPAGELPNASEWKFGWLFNVPDYPAHSPYYYDMCLPSYTAQNLLRLAGDSYTPQPDVNYNMTAWWTWGKWMRITTWLKANTSDPTLNGTIYWQAFQEGAGKVYSGTRTDTPVFHANSSAPTPPNWNEIQVPGWLREGGTNIAPLYDDVYVAAGPNAAARVEIGDNPVYADCGNLELLTPTSWSNGQIAATVQQGSFKSGQPAYVFVFDANNNGNTSSGYKVTIGGVSASPPPTSTPPSPPANVHIVQ